MFIVDVELARNGVLVGSGVSISPERLQTPLNVALGIPPFFLLGSYLLANVSIGKPRLVEVFTGTCPLGIY